MLAHAETFALDLRRDLATIEDDVQ